MTTEFKGFDPVKISDELVAKMQTPEAKAAARQLFRTTKYGAIKARLLQFLIFVQFNFPMLIPIVDRIAHSFGLCLGH